MAIITQTSLTLVSVAPVQIRSPSFEKKLLESLFSINFSGSNPNCLARFRVHPSIIAPAAVCWSINSVSAKRSNYALLVFFKVQSGRQCKFLISASHTFSLNGHSCFSASDNTQDLEVPMQTKPSLASFANDFPTSLASPFNKSANNNVLSPLEAKKSTAAKLAVRLLPITKL